MMTNNKHTLLEMLLGRWYVCSEIKVLCTMGHLGGAAAGSGLALETSSRNSSLG